VVAEQLPQGECERLVADLEDGAQLSLRERMGVAAEHVDYLAVEVGRL